MSSLDMGNSATGAPFVCLGCFLKIFLNMLRSLLCR
jgi:hypothetical protein